MLAQIASDKLFKSLDQIEEGTLKLTMPNGQTRVFEGAKPGKAANVELFDWRVIKNLATKGDIGFVEDYRAGNWKTDNLPNLLEISLLNHRAFQKYVLGNSFFRVLSRFANLTRLNTIKGSKKIFTLIMIWVMIFINYGLTRP